MLCFCGSGKPHSECHAQIHPNSLVAELYKTQSVWNSGTQSRKQECCSRCLCVSEIEFVQILDYLNHTCPDELQTAIQTSKQQMNILRKQAPELARLFEGTVPLHELIRPNGRHLPFPCIFWENNSCSIYPVRPLICRFSCPGMDKKESCDEHCPPFIENGDMQKYKEALYFLLLYPWQNQLLIRRPVPLFYYFQMLFKDTDTKPIFADKMLQLKKEDYIRWLVLSGQPKAEK